ncbi:hypothetical protein BABINDRAFT_10309 [Babjeviella inositovora NRRL Y-12698]|uniref:Uncharacterized protein n=1 Tax=Babjeviella inositovora NRRL Y-12698 TaxID=984486 RepID=A0A1E3QHI3_9ASCO|nr:uncharacterized protein BABINDRAFT_10309 [Babjeviella inositovora NRRL Y-12698]ODQ77155.1 hypothetical protein BABINDRAFT_10309 [Babjeviella inositovora NRRL Y-12698]
MIQNSSQTRWVYDHDTPNIRVLLTTDPLSIQEAIDFAKTPLAGAVVTFNGITRADPNPSNTAVVKALVYEAHKALALRSLFQAAAQTFARFNQLEHCIHRIFVVHRLGEVGIMEDSILIALSSSHRQEGWAAAEYLLELIKAKTEIWKNEVYEDGHSEWKANQTQRKAV